MKNISKITAEKMQLKIVFADVTDSCSLHKRCKSDLDICTRVSKYSFTKMYTYDNKFWNISIIHLLLTYLKCMDYMYNKKYI